MQTQQWLLAAIGHNYAHNFSWLGRPVIQVPQDIYATQEILWRVQPDLVIETGIAHGGSLILSASMLAMIDYCEAARSGATLTPGRSHRRVIGIDIEAVNFAAEYRDRVFASFLADRPDFKAEDAAEAAIKSGQLTDAGAKLVHKCRRPDGSVRLTPRTAATDGFYMAVMRRIG